MLASCVSSFPLHFVAVSSLLPFSKSGTYRSHTLKACLTLPCLHPHEPSTHLDSSPSYEAHEQLSFLLLVRLHLGLQLCLCRSIRRSRFLLGLFLLSESLVLPNTATLWYIILGKGNGALIHEFWSRRSNFRIPADIGPNHIKSRQLTINNFTTSYELQTSGTQVERIN